MKKQNSGKIVFFDFDNTITDFDILDDIIEKFSINDEWKQVEEDWKNRIIGSKESLTKQLAGIRITREKLLEYIKTIRIDSSFKKILDLFEKKNIEIVILSDNFKFIIENILKFNNFKGIKVIANKLKVNKDKLIPEFPLTNKYCHFCGHCKIKHLLEATLRDKIIFYVGDGLSDTCPANIADFVFAKATLLEHIKSKKVECSEFKNIKHLFLQLQEVFNG